jgi:cell division protein FtsI/penicillin-binding protein 2
MAYVTRGSSGFYIALALIAFVRFGDAQTSAANSLRAQAIQSTLTRGWPPSERLSWLVLDARSGQVLAQQWPSVDDSIPVGSLTKPFVALAYARTHTAFPHTLCRGTQGLCWLRKGHGSLDLEHALAYSCNAYFLALARELDPNAMQSVLRLYGLPAVRQSASTDSSDANQEENPEILIGLKPEWRIAPVTLAHAYIRLAIEADSQPADGAILRGMRLAAQQGTARALRAEDALAPTVLAKTGTAPCVRGCMGSGDGLVIALTPADEPRILLMVRERGTTGATTAIIAAQMLHALKVQNVVDR